MIDALALRHAAVLANPAELARALDLVDRDSKQLHGSVKFLCPAHGDRDPSCNLFIGKDGTVVAFCHSCSWTGDALSLIAKVRGLDVKADFRRVCEIALEIAGGSIAPGSKAHLSSKRDAVSDMAYSSVWKGVLRRSPLSSAPSVSAYLKRRGVFADAEEVGCGGYPDDARALIADLVQSFERVDLEECGALLSWREPVLAFRDLGYFLLIPWRERDGRLSFVQIRSLDNRKDKYMSLGDRSARAPFGVDLLEDALRHHGPTAEVIICEGALDALARRRLARERGEAAAVIAIPSAGSPLVGMPFDLLAGHRVVIATDNDAAGDRAARKLRDALPADADVVRERPPNGANDWGSVVEVAS